MKLFIQSYPSTAVTVETQTNSPCTPTSQPVEAADDDLISATFFRQIHFAKLSQAPALAGLSLAIFPT